MPTRVCQTCNKDISKLPEWLEGVEVKFQCAECSTKAAFIAPPIEKYVADIDSEEEIEIAGEEEEEDVVIVEDDTI